MRREDWVLAGVMGSVHFAFHLFMRIVPPLIPVLTMDLGLSLSKLGLLVGVYFAGSSIGLLPAGVLSDASDRRTTLCAGITLVSLGYLAFGLSPALGGSLPAVTVGPYTTDGTLLAMGAAMFVAGLGTSVHVPVGVPIITANAGENARGKLLGVWGGASKLGDAATPALVGVLIVAFAWDEIVLALGVLGLGYAVALFGALGLDRFDTVPVTRSDDAETTADEAGSHRETDRRVYLYPMVVLTCYFAGYQIAVQGVVAFTPTFVSEVYEFSFTAAGVRFAPESFADFALSVLLVAGAVTRFVAGTLVDRYDHKSVLLGSLIVATAGLYVFTFVSLGPLALLAVLAVFGGAFWGNSPARDSLISELSPANREGRTFSYLWTASRVFGAASPIALGVVADSVGIRRGFAYLVPAVFLSVVAIALLFSERVYVHADRRDEPTP